MPLSLIDILFTLYGSSSAIELAHLYATYVTLSGFTRVDEITQSLHAQTSTVGAGVLEDAFWTSIAAYHAVYVLRLHNGTEAASEQMESRLVNAWELFLDEMSRI